MKQRILTAILTIVALAAATAAQTNDIFKRQNIESRMLQVAKWQLANPNHALYDWNKGAFYAGLFKDQDERLLVKEETLYARDASYMINNKGEGKREANGKKVFWSRGNGWVVGGLVRLLKELPKDYPKRDFYVTQYKAMIERIA